MTNDEMDSIVGSSRVKRDTDDKERPVVLITTIDIGPGKSELVEMRKNDDPVEVAHNFCKLHNMPESVMGPLAAHLSDNYEKAMKKHASRQDAASAAAPSAGVRTDGAEQLIDAPEAPRQRRPVTAKAPEAARGPREPLARPTTAPAGGKRGGGGGVGAGSVFNRLYDKAVQQAERAKTRVREAEEHDRELLESGRLAITPVSAHMAQQRNRGDYANYGEYLYIEGLSDLELKKRRAHEAARERDLQELEGVTFAPRISNMAQRLQSRAIPAWQRLGTARARQQSEQKRAAYLSQCEQQELAECTFRPRINHHSARMMEERMEVLREHNITAHDQLFQDANRRRLRREEYETWYPEEITFQPAINKARPRGASEAADRCGAMVSTFDSRGGRDVAERLYELSKEQQAKLDRLRAEAASGKDPTTGERLFHPKTGRAPRTFTRNAGQLPVGEYLYSMRHEFEDKKEYLAQVAQAEQQSQSRPRVSAASQAMLEALKMKRFTQIFQYLDEHDDGTLDLLSVTAHPNQRFVSLDPEVRTDVEGAMVILARLNGWLPPGATLQQVLFDPAVRGAFDDDLRERVAAGRAAAAGGGAPNSGAEVDLDQFKRLMAEAVAARRGVPRTYLLPNAHTRHVDENLTFQPSINANTDALAAKRRPEGLPAYELLHQEASVVKARKDEARRIRELEELGQCTFQPQLVSEQLAFHGKAVALASKMHSSMTHLRLSSGQLCHSLDCVSLSAAQLRSDAPVATRTGPRHDQSLMSLAGEADGGEDICAQVEREVEQALASRALSDERVPDSLPDDDNNNHTMRHHSPRAAQARADSRGGDEGGLRTGADSELDRFGERRGGGDVDVGEMEAWSDLLQSQLRREVVGAEIEGH